MLELSSNIKREGAGLSPRRCTRYGVEALPVGPAIVVVNGLRKIVTVAQRHAADFGGASIDGLELDAEVARSLEICQFHGKLLMQCLDYLMDRRVLAARILKLLFGFHDQPGALEARPGPDRDDLSRQVAKCRQPFERRVHPAIQGYEGRAHVSGIVTVRLGLALEGSPIRSADIGSLRPRSVNLGSHVPAECASDDGVGSPVLLTDHTASADSGCQPVGEYLG